MTSMLGTNKAMLLARVNRSLIRQSRLVLQLSPYHFLRVRRLTYTYLCNLVRGQRKDDPLVHQLQQDRWSGEPAAIRSKD